MKQTRLNPISKKKQIQNEEYKKVCEKIKESREEKCEGCGNINFLSFSHLIPRSRNNELITDEDNIRIHCLSCHQIWESGNLEEKKKMLDFKKNMEYLQDIDLELYNLIIMKG